MKLDIRILLMYFIFLEYCSSLEKSNIRNRFIKNIPNKNNTKNISQFIIKNITTEENNEILEKTINSDSSSDLMKENIFNNVGKRTKVNVFL